MTTAGVVRCLLEASSRFGFRMPAGATRDYFSRGADQAPVQPSNRELAPGLRPLLGLTVKLGIRCLGRKASQLDWAERWGHGR